MLDPLLASLPWLHIQMVLWSQLMSQPLSLLGPTIWPPRAMPSMPLSPADQDTLTPLLPLLPPPLLPQLALPTQLATLAHFTSPGLWPTPMEP